MKSKQAVVIGNEELSFNTDEIYELFKIRRKNATVTEAKAALALTGGWAIAVNALSQSSEPAPEYLNLNALVRYVRENIWPEWDETTREFLIASAAVDEMPVALCEKITGRTDAGALLEQLQTRNAYLTRIEDGVYRYHHLFLDSLRTLPEYIEMDKKNVWRIAAEYYANEKDIFSATNYAYKSKNLKTILDILGGYMTIREIPMYEYTNNLKDLLYAEFMEELCEECPVLFSTAAYMFFIIGDAKNFEINIDKLKQHLPVIMLEYPKFAEYAINNISFDYRTPLGPQLDYLNELPSIVFQANEIKNSTYSFQMPFLHRGRRDFYKLADKKTYDKWVKISKRIIKNHYEQIIHGISAGFYLEQNRVNEALNEAQKANGELTGDTAKEIRFSVYMHLAAVYLALDKETELAALLEKVEMFINEDAEFLRPNFLAFTSKTELWNGETGAAREWLDHYFVNESVMIEPYKLYQHFTTIRAFAVLGEFEKAKALAVRVRKMGRDFHRPQDAAEAGVLLAACLWAEDIKEESQEIMETVLSEMQPYSFIRLIADEGAAVLQVLKKILGRIEHANYSGRLDSKYVNSVYITAYTISKRRGGIMAGLKPKPVKLSQQQKMIIRLLAQGYKRESIIERTGLSLSTVKTHINIAYSKLGADSAANAVVKARELGIIE
jgi:LuxR family maltose regulon positive regulatory protein